MTRDKRDSDAPEADELDASPSSRALVPLRHEDGTPIVSPRVVRRATVIAEALFLTREGPPPAERMAWLALEIEDFLARAGARSRLVLGLALLAVGILAPLLSFRFVSLARMSVAERAKVLGHLEDVFGPPVLAVKALLSVIYYEHPDAAREIGFDGSCLGHQPPELPSAP